ncbi:MAG: hypothetical protein KatS3mg082_1774 [Nitrospiraceae bacterium]|nr:MAG: hypothetical protein KatS3mg082_1774 [Nitrospiraceae bacterium]
MTELVLVKAPGAVLAPADDQAASIIERWRVGEGVRAKVARMRNVRFHRKFFALLHVAFDAWEPQPREYRGEPAAKNFERFRKDLLILAGFADPVVNLKGEVRMEPKSISFAAMDEDEFQQVYDRVADVILQRVLRTYTREDLDRVVQEIVGFL